MIRQCIISDFQDSRSMTAIRFWRSISMAFRNFAVKNQIMEILHPHPKCVNSWQQFSCRLYTEWQEELSSALTSLAELFADEHTVAAYEIQSSGIIGTLLSGLISEETAGVTKKLFTERANTFRKTFSQYPQRFVLTNICMIFFLQFLLRCCW